MHHVVRRDRLELSFCDLIEVAHDAVCTVHVFTMPSKIIFVLIHLLDTPVLQDFCLINKILYDSDLSHIFIILCSILGGSKSDTKMSLHMSDMMMI